MKLFSSRTAAQVDFALEATLTDPFSTTEKVAELERIAAGIPSMGGREIGPFLKEAASAAPTGTHIVEFGSWLGAGTAQLALGLLERGLGQQPQIHCYDQWYASPSEVRKAASTPGFFLTEGQDTLALVIESLRPFNTPVQFHKGDIGRAKWNGAPISVHVDDACKKPKLFFHVLQTFGPAWIPEETVVVLMDFNFWKRARSKSYRCQRDFIEQHPEHFQLISSKHLDDQEWAAFRYLKRLDFTTLRHKRFAAWLS